MKPKTHLGTSTEVAQNIVTARQILAELKYLIFTPAPEYKVKKGFIAILPRPHIYPSLILLRSRGSFLDVQFNSTLFSGVIMSRLRRGLWTPLHIGQDLVFDERNVLQHIEPTEQCEFEELLKTARLL